MELDEIANKLFVVGVGHKGPLKEQSQYQQIISKLMA